MEAFKIKCKMFNLTAYLKLLSNSIRFKHDSPADFPYYVRKGTTFWKIINECDLGIVGTCLSKPLVHAGTLTSNLYHDLKAGKLEKHGYHIISESEYKQAKWLLKG